MEDQAHGEPTDDQGRGEPTDDTHGEPTDDQARGEPTDDQGRREPTDDQAHIEPTDDQTHGEPTNDQGRGEPTDDQAHGGPTDDQGRGERTDDQAHGKPTDDQAHGKPTDDQAHGEPTDDQAHGEPKDDQGRGEPTDDQTHGEPTDDQARGEPTDDQGRREPTDDQAHIEPTDDQTHGEPTNDQGRGEPTDDQAHGGPTDDQGRGERTDDQAHGKPTDDQAHGKPTDDQAHGEPTDDQAHGEPTDDQGRGEPTDDQGRGEPTDDQANANGSNAQHLLFTKSSDLEELLTSAGGDDRESSPAVSSASIPSTSGEVSQSQGSRTKKKQGGSRRVIQSRYMSSAMKRATCSPADLMAINFSCRSLNQTGLFAPAGSSTPLARSNGRLSIAPSTNNASGEQTVRIRQPPTVSGQTVQIRKPDQQRAVKPKAVRALGLGPGTQKEKKQDVRSNEPLPEEDILYNQYLMYAYMRARSEVNGKQIESSLQTQACQLAQLVTDKQDEVCDLKRRLQAVSIYKNVLIIQRQVATIASQIQEHSAPVMDDVRRLTSYLQACRNKLKMYGFAPIGDELKYISELLPVVEKFHGAVGRLHEAMDGQADLLQASARGLNSIHGMMTRSVEHVTRSSEMLDSLCSAALEQSSLIMSRQIRDDHSDPSILTAVD